MVSAKNNAARSIAALVRLEAAGPLLLFQDGRWGTSYRRSEMDARRLRYVTDRAQIKAPASTLSGISRNPAREECRGCPGNKENSGRQKAVKAMKAHRTSS
ncbi:hypothetical protein Y032_0164g3534 [Ancylostoma ceylanicum]|uniref:Uncharacterized protein n=1 Tax=Ancylostoma ceylanicum TaxID=53326 RepID=A0A016SX73_9BILA|nr:hypothetical protein Y032_0164g3534 [Ancylostoma ceylanicum]